MSKQNLFSNLTIDKQKNLKYVLNIQLIGDIKEDIYSVHIMQDITVNQKWRFGGCIANMLEIEIIDTDTNKYFNYLKIIGTHPMCTLKLENMDTGAKSMYLDFFVDKVESISGRIIKITAYSSLFYLNNKFKYDINRFPCSLTALVNRIAKDNTLGISMPIYFDTDINKMMNDCIITPSRSKYLEEKSNLEILRDIGELLGIFIYTVGNSIYFYKESNKLYECNNYDNDENSNNLINIVLNNDVAVTNIVRNFKENYINNLPINPTKTDYPFVFNNNNCVAYCFNDADLDKINNDTNNRLYFKGVKLSTGELNGRANFGTTLGNIINVKRQHDNSFVSMLVTNIEINNYSSKITAVEQENTDNSQETLTTLYTIDNYIKYITEYKSGYDITFITGTGSGSSSLRKYESSLNIIYSGNVIILDPITKLIQNDIKKESELQIDFNFPISFNDNTFNNSFPMDFVFNYGYNFFIGIIFDNETKDYMYLDKIGLAELNIKINKNQNFNDTNMFFLSGTLNYNLSKLKENNEILNNKNNKNCKLFVDFEEKSDYSFCNNNTSANTHILTINTSMKQNRGEFIRISYKNLHVDNLKTPETYIFNSITALDLLNRPSFIKDINFTNVVHPNVDSSKSWVINNTNGDKYIKSNIKGVTSGHSYGYIKFELTNNSKIEFTAKISSEKNWDFGYTYVNKSPLPFDSMTNQDVKNKTDYGGTWIYIESGEVGYKTITTSALSPGTYYINFGYIKDGSGSSGEDAFFIDNIKIQEIPEH